MARFRTARRSDTHAPEQGESEPAVVEREAEEALTSALQDSDTATEILQDSAEDATRPATRRLLLGAVGLTLSLSSVFAARHIQGARRRQARPSRLRDALRRAARRGPR